MYPGKQGYIRNYPGRVDHFDRDGDLPLYKGTPPTTNVDITRIIVFRDQYNTEHIVFVRGAQICEVRGNGYRILYTLVGSSENGQFFPHLFVHQSKLVVCNFGDPVLIWNGIDAVNPLGVHETPQPPDLRAQLAPGTNEAADYGYWAWKNVWWTGKRPISGPTTNLDINDEPIVGIYNVVQQFVDEYGNKGRPSSPSRTVVIDPEILITTPAVSDYKSAEYLVSVFNPPMVEDHIAGCLLGRSTNLNPADANGGLGAYGLYYVEHQFNNVTIGRYVHQNSDASLLSFDQVDMSVTPPQQAAGGFSFGSRIYLYGLEDSNVLAYSDVALFGQFRPLQQYRAYDDISCAIPVGDRVAVITKSSLEVLYDSEAGLAVLSVDLKNGSVYGRSFADVGGAIFGLWNDGFGFFDGQAITRVETPYWLQDMYVDNKHNVHSAKVSKDYYILTLRLSDSQSSKNNRIVMFNLKTKMWYILDESVYDLHEWEDGWLGVDDSIYELFKGSTFAESRMVFEGLIPGEESVSQVRSINSLSILMEPSSGQAAQVEISTEASAALGQSRDAYLMPTEGSMYGPGGSETFPAWNNVNLLYSDEPDWDCPGDYWSRMSFSAPISGYFHKVDITVPAGNLFRARGLAIDFGSPVGVS